MNSEFMMNLNNLTRDERKEFARLFEKATMKEKQRIAWEPKKGDEYYTISDFGVTQFQNWYDDEQDHGAYGIGNVYKTTEDAEFAIEKLKVKTELERYALEYNDQDLEKWNGHNNHCKIAYDEGGKKVFIDFNKTLRCESATYFTSEKIAEDAIKSIGENRIKKYLFNVEVE